MKTAITTAAKTAKTMKVSASIITVFIDFSIHVLRHLLIGPYHGLAAKAF